MVPPKQVASPIPEYRGSAPVIPISGVKIVKDLNLCLSWDSSCSGYPKSFLFVSHPAKKHPFSQTTISLSLTNSVSSFRVLPMTSLSDPSNVGKRPKGPILRLSRYRF